MSKIKDTKESWNGKTYSEVEEFVKGELDRKAERAESPTAGNIATLDENGNVTDSGRKPSEFITEHQPLKTVNGIALTGEGDIEIPRGNDAVNPFKGWFDTDRDLPEQGETGDYAYVKGASSSDSATIYKWNGTEFENTGRTVDTSNVQTFGSSESVANVKIDSTGLKNPETDDDTNNPVLAKASDVMPLRCKLDGVTAEEVKVENVTEWKNGGESSVFYDGSEWKNASSTKYTLIDITGYKKVRFLGFSGSSTSLYYVFLDDGYNVIASKIYYNGSSNLTKCEITENIPDNAAYFGCACECWGNSQNTQRFTMTDFYCYLISGKNVIEEIKAGDKALMRVIDENIYTRVEITDYYTPLKRALYVTGTTYKWNMSNNSFSHIEIPIAKGEEYIIHRDPDKEIDGTTPAVTRYAIAKQPSTYDATQGDNGRLDIEFASETTKAVEVKNGESARIVIEEDYGDEYYLIVDCGPMYRTRVYKVENISKIQDRKIEEINSNMDFIESTLFKYIESEFDTSVTNMKNLTNATNATNVGKWGSSESYKHYEIDLRNVLYVKIKTKSETATRYFFTNTNTAEPGTPIDLYQKDPSFHKINKGQEITIKIPDGASYMMVYAGRINDKTIVPVVESIKIVTTEKKEVSDSNNWSMLDVMKDENDALIIGNPISEDSPQIEVLQKKILQMTKIRWIPKKDILQGVIDGNESGNLYISGLEYEGIPYSGNAGRSVGMGVSFETFMTAINNKYSLMYTEDLLHPDLSPWHEFNLAITRKPTNDHCRLYYGTYCNAFALAVTGMDVVMGCSGIVQAATHIWSKRVPQLKKEYIRTGDIFSTAKSTVHTRIVYAVERDGNGKVTGIYVAEATGNKNVSPNRTCVINNYSEENLEKYLRNISGYTHFNNNMLFMDVNYEPSKFVKLEGETTQDYDYNNDVCTFAGNKAVFLNGDSVVINYNLNDETSWRHTHLHLYYGNTKTGTVNLSNLNPDDYPESQYNHALIVNGSLLTRAGKYSVRAGDQNEGISDATEFEIVSDDVTFRKITDSLYHVTYNDIPTNWKVVGVVCQTNTVDNKTLTCPLPNNIGSEFIINIKMTAQKLGLTYIPDGYISLIVKTEFGIIRTNPHAVSE